MGSKHWSQADKQALAALYPETSNEVLGRVFGKSPKAIGLMARSLGVCKSARYMAEEVPRIKPGQEPWNKGQSFDPGGRSVETRFKPGRAACEAANYKPIGSLRITKDGYLEQKTTDDPLIVPARRWVALHRLVWERENGPVPNGHIVVFRPGMHTTEPDQITADRVECITRAENMRRNTYHRYGPEVAKLVQLRGAINRQIRKREKEQNHEHH